MQWASIKYSRTLDEKIARIPRIIIDREIVHSRMPKIKITPRAKHPGQTETFLNEIHAALDIFEDELGSLQADVRAKAYKHFIRAYRTSLTPNWDLVHFADVAIVLSTIRDKEMKELTIMAKKLEPQEPIPQIEQEQRNVPSVDMITGVMMSQYPKQDLPNTDVCKKIGEVFKKLSEAHEAYSQAAEGLAQLASEVSPEHFTLLLTASTTPVIQVVVPPTMNLPVVAPPPMPKSAATAEERAMVIDFTKTQVLPDANSSALIDCEKNNATRVLAAAIYSVLEKKFFDTVHPRADVATAFQCNTSQLSKALTGIEYASGPHQYTPKKSATKKRPAEEGEQSTTAKTGKQSTKAPQKQHGAAQATTPRIDEHSETFKLRTASKDAVDEESSSSDLPPGLF